MISHDITLYDLISHLVSNETNNYKYVCLQRVSFILNVKHEPDIVCMSLFVRKLGTICSVNHNTFNV